MSTLQIAKELNRDHPTIKKFVTKTELCNGRSDKGKIRKRAPFSLRAMNKIKREVRRNPCKTSKTVFQMLMYPKQLSAYPEKRCKNVGNQRFALH